MEKVKLVYIMGRGHSGSTVLDAVLGNHRDIESVGELVSGLSRFEGEICSCGHQTRQCDFWKRVVEAYEESDTELPFSTFCRLAIRQANVKNFFTTLFSRHKYDKLVESNLAIFKAISGVNDKTVIVDSNKEPSRALLLLKNIPETHIIHLVRHPVNVVASTYFRIKNGDKIQFFRLRFHPKGFAAFFVLMLISASWSAGNFLSEIIKLIYGSKRILTLRYEDFLRNPNKELDRIGSFVGVDMEELTELIYQNSHFYIGHNIGGNKFRHDKTFQLRRNETRRPMPRAYRFLVKFMNFPMMLYYKYSVWK